MSRITTIQLGTEVRLREWARWYVQSLEEGLGYPSKSTLVTALQGSRSTVPHYVKDNQSAEEVHKIYLQLQKIYPIRAEVLKQEYTRDKNQTVEVVARKLGLQKRNYYTLLSLAKTFVEAKLFC